MCDLGAVLARKGASKMSENENNENHSIAEHGQPVEMRLSRCYGTEELAELLCKIHFSAHYGPYIEGKHVAITINPSWNEDGERILF